MDARADIGAPASLAAPAPRVLPRMRMTLGQCDPENAGTSLWAWPARGLDPGAEQVYAAPMPTSKKVSSKAGKLLENPKSSKTVKSVAGAALAETKKKPRRG